MRNRRGSLKTCGNTSWISGNSPLTGREESDFSGWCANHTADDRSGLLMGDPFLFLFYPLLHPADVRPGPEQAAVFMQLHKKK